MNIAPRQVEGLLEKLVTYHQGFASAFRRREQRGWSCKYLEGQLLDIERKSIEPMANALVGGNVQAMQQFVSQGAWADEEVIALHQAQVAHRLGQPDGVLILDGCDFPKQGQDSVGGARQYCGALGKLANCQASVVLVYASERGATLLDRRLYLPQEWFGEDHHQRWQRCGIPKATAFQTRPELGGAMVEAVCASGEVPFRWVAMDEGYGKSPTLLNRIHQKNKWFFAEIPRLTRSWRRRPQVRVPAASATGRPPTQLRLATGEPASHRVDHLAVGLPAQAWQAFIIHEGSKGPLAVEIAAVRVVMAEDDLPGREEWLVVRRASSRQPVEQWKYYRSNASALTAVTTLARMTAWRWPVETVLEECKGELGFDHYEVRGWRGWQHHTTLTMLAHHFLVQLRVEMGKEAPALTVSQARRLLQVVLPKREFDAQAALAEIERIQRQNHAAYRSHRKRHRRKLKAKSSSPN